MENNNDFKVDYVAIGRRIRAIRKKLGKTQEEFSKLAFPGEIKGQSYVSGWERGGFISTENLLKIARAGNVSLDWLVTGDSFKPAGIENNRFTLREICAALSQAILLCGASIDTVKNEKGEPVILCTFPVGLIDNNHPAKEEYLSFETIARFLAAFSSVVSLDNSHDAFAHASNDLSMVHECGGTIGIGVSRLGKR